MTHFPKDRRIKNAILGDMLLAVKFGDIITANHKVLSEEGGSRNNHPDAVVVQDFAT